MIYWSKIISLIIVTFIVLNIFYIYNFNLYSKIISNNINLYKSFLPEYLFNSIIINNECNQQSLIICKSAKFPDIVIQANIAIFGAELSNLIILIITYTYFFLIDHDYKNKDRKQSLLQKNNYAIGQIQVHILFDMNIYVSIY